MVYLDNFLYLGNIFSKMYHGYLFGLGYGSGLFFISDILVGVGHGFSLIGAFSFIHIMTDLNNRAAIMSTYLFVGYLGTIIPIVGVGFIADGVFFRSGFARFFLVFEFSTFDYH